MVPTASATEHVATANQILTNARSLRESLATESTEAHRKLADAVLDVLLYSEKVENMGRLLALADACIGQIRYRMHTHRIPIDPPSTSLSTATVSNLVNGPVVSGKFIFFKSSRHVCSDWITEMRVESA